MGACFSDRLSPRNNSSQSTYQAHQGKSFECLLDCNPQLQQEIPAKSLMPPTAITAPSSVETDSKVKSIISLEEALEKSRIDVGDDEEIQNLQSWLESHNTTSSIIQIPKSKRVPASSHNKQEQPAKSSIILRGLKDCEGMSGNMETSRFMSKMVVTSDLADIEFMLPLSRAGPLVVPYIAYEHYVIARQTIIYNNPQAGGRRVYSHLGQYRQPRGC